MQISIWEKESFYAPKDVMIIGSGLVGLWTAYHLKKQHPALSVTIIDRGSIPTGASTRNAGFACFGSLTELRDDLNKMGEEKMLELVSMRYQGLRKIRKVFSSEEIDFEICGGYELINGIGKAELREDVEMLNGLLNGIIKDKKIFRFADKKIGRFGFNNINHLLENKLEGYLHSGKLCQSLLRLVQSMGVTVLNNINVTGLEDTGNKILVRTEAGIELRAGKVLICTNAFARDLLPDLDVVPARGQILLTSPVDKLPFKGTFHYDEGYYYFRNLGNRVLLGGARNKAFVEEGTTEMDITGKIQEELEHFLAHYILPGREYQITDRWSGIMAMGAEKLPVIKEISPGIFCAVRMNGMGVALAPVVGEKVVRLMNL